MAGPNFEELRRQAILSTSLLPNWSLVANNIDPRAEELRRIAILTASRKQRTAAETIELLHLLAKLKDDPTFNGTAMQAEAAKIHHLLSIVYHDMIKPGDGGDFQPVYLVPAALLAGSSSQALARKNSVPSALPDIATKAESKTFVSDPALEERVTALGLKLFKAAQNYRENPVIAAQAKLTTSLSESKSALNAIMRFADVLPEIENDAQEVLSHFRQYMDAPDVKFPWLVAWGVDVMKWRVLPDAAKAAIICKMVRMMASAYIAGETAESASPKLLAMAKDGMGVIADIMGEAVTSDEEADDYQKKYLDLIEKLATDTALISQLRLNRQKPSSIPVFSEDEQHDVQVAIKFSGLLPRSSWIPEAPEQTADLVKKRFRPILDKILQVEQNYHVKVALTVDPEEFEYRDLTTRILKEVLMEQKYLHMGLIGLGVQVFNKDGLAVLKDLNEWSGKRMAINGGRRFGIREIKGAYWDYENLQTAKHGYPLPVLTEKWMSDANFEECADYLFDQGRNLRPSFGSHNLRAISYVVTKSREKQVPIQIQMLYGMANNSKYALVLEGVPVEVYTPIGALLPGMAYMARRLLENASQDSFLLQSRKGADIKQLLANPREGKIWPPVFDAPPDPNRLTDLNDPFVNEALTDFSRDAHRLEVKQALDQLTQLGLLRAERLKTKNDFVDFPLIVDGQEVTSTAGTLISTNPGNPDEVMGVVAMAGPEQIKAIVKKANDAFKDWSQTPVRERALTLLRAAQIMRQEKVVLTALVMKEAGKTVREADGEVVEAIDFLEYYARRAVLMEESNPDIKIKAKGVAAVIAPWNFPLAILAGMSAAALVTGNTVVAKASEKTPVIAKYLAYIFQRSGMPEGVFNELPADREGGKMLRQQPEIKLEVFTGSKGVGLEMYEQDMPRGVRVISEMGGKNAMIIDRDAHPDEVISYVLQSKFGYGGQKCSALDRLIIVGSQAHYTKMIDRLQKAVLSLRVGSVDNTGNFYGPMIDENTKERLVDLIARANGETVNTSTGKPIPAQGTLLVDGRKHPGLPHKGAYLGPTLFDVTDTDTELFQEEFFGPILAMTRAATLDEAIILAEKSLFGLTAGAITRSPDNEKLIMRTWNAVGNLYINRNMPGAVNGRNPFGGDRLSGIGGSKAGGEDYLWQFVDVEHQPDVFSAKYGSHWQKFFVQTRNAAATRLKTPVYYQPYLLGEENRVVYRARGQGLIMIQESTTLFDAAGLVATAIGTGNHVLVTYTPAAHAVARQIEGLIKKNPHWNAHVEFIRQPESGDIPDVIKHAKWIAFGSKQEAEANTDILKMAAQTPSGQNFVRLVIGADVKATDPSIFQAMTIPKTVTRNTARHGFDAREQKKPPQGPTGGDSGTGSSSGSTSSWSQRMGRDHGSLFSGSLFASRGIPTGNSHESPAPVEDTSVYSTGARVIFEKMRREMIALAEKFLSRAEQQPLLNFLNHPLSFNSAFLNSCATLVAERNKREKSEAWRHLVQRYKDAELNDVADRIAAFTGTFTEAQADFLFLGSMIENVKVKAAVVKVVKTFVPAVTSGPVLSPRPGSAVGVGVPVP